MKKPYFSIIIPTLNEEKYLPHLLADLSSQSFRDFEVIVVDGHSSDQTIAQAKKSSSQLPSLSVINSSKRNVSTQRNLGAKKSSGVYLLFMDGDNRLPLYFLEGIHYRLLSSPVDLFTTWCSPDSSKPAEKTITTAINLLVEAAKVIDYEGALGAFIGCKRTTFLKGKGFDYRLGYAEDGEFIRRYTHQGYSFNVFRDPLFTYSLRRFRTNGTLQTFQQTARLYLKQVTGFSVARSEYPMGGHVFTDSKQTLKGAAKSLQRKIKLFLET